MPKFTSKAANVINKSMYLASELGHTYIGSEHLLLAILSESDCVAARLLDSRGVDFDEVRSAVVSKIGSGERTKVTSGDLTPGAKRIIEAAAYQASRFGKDNVGTEHILMALAGEPDSVALSVLGTLGVTALDVSSDVEDFLDELNGERHKKDGRSHPAMLKRDAPNIAKYGRDLTALARTGKLDPIIGRDSETERVIQILSRRQKNNPCLIGEPGVGKTAVVEGLARLIAAGAAPETLAGKIIVTLDIPSMIAGAKYRGEFEERMKAVMAEAAKNPGIILFIDEIHTLVGAGAAEGAVDAANILKPALARGEIQLIGATTTDEYRRYIEKDAALERRFGAVNVGEPSPEGSILILQGLRAKYEAHHKVKITDEAIAAAVNMSVRYIGDRYLPDKAIDLIDEAASRVRIAGITDPPEIKEMEAEIKRVQGRKESAILNQSFEEAAGYRDAEKTLRAEYTGRVAALKADREKRTLVVGEDEVAEIVKLWTGIPVKQLEGEEAERLLALGDALKSHIIGQDEAADKIASAVRRGRAGLKDPKRPIGSFIFLGPTGVGKTELCLRLAEELFADKDALIRVDMSEFMESHSVSKLIGSPPGYVGHDEGGQLTERVRRKPYSVVLFDEIEKAHHDVFGVLLQILEDGVLTDSKGRKADFKNTVIVMTSNVGAASLTERRKSLGFTGTADDSAEEAVMSALREAFRPEFLNRVDEIIIFGRLTKEDILKITELMLDEMKGRAAGLGIDMEFSRKLAEAVANEGYSEIYGARPLRRVIQRRIEDALSDKIIGGEFKSGDRITADVGGDGEIVFIRREM